MAVYSRNTYEAIKKKLVEKYNVNQEKIISFEGLFFEQRVDQVMLSALAKNKTYDGVILGISHACCGINPQYLKGNWCNLASTSEDIFGHMKVMEKCINEYRDVILNLKKVIIDLWDYPIFYHDFSRCKNYIGALARGAYCEDTHNFKLNGNYNSHDIDKLLLECGNGEYYSAYARMMRPLRKKLFDESKVFEMYERGDLPLRIGEEYSDFFKPEFRNNTIQKEPVLPANLYHPRKFHEEVISQNVGYLHNLVDLIKCN